MVYQLFWIQYPHSHLQEFLNKFLFYSAISNYQIQYKTGQNKEDPHCFGYIKDLIFVIVIGIFVKISTVPTQIVQYSLS